MSISEERQRRIEAGRRKNRAIRKLLRIDGLDTNVRIMAVTLIDFLSSDSGYEVAWPSVRRLAKRLCISERTAKRHLASVRKLGIFNVIQLSPSEASDYLARLGVEAKFSRCRKYAPNIYRVAEHPIWWDKEKLDKKYADRMLELLDGESAH